MSQRLHKTALVAIVALFVASVPAVPQAATSGGDRPAPPAQPVSGPGGAEYAFPGVRVTSLGDGPGGGRVFEPTTEVGNGAPAASGPFPLVLLLDGCCYRAEGSTFNGGGGDGGQGFRAWIEHLVRRGAIVVYPAYGSSTAGSDVAAAMGAALAVLTGNQHAMPDLARSAVISFSFGGPLAADYVATAASSGLPIPTALLVYGPSRIYPAPHRPPPPSTLRALVVRGSDDPGALPGTEALWEWLDPLPVRQRDFVTLSSDDRGTPLLSAVHVVPLTNERPANPVIALDALDWFGTWKLTDALLACAFDGEWCDYAFGDTPEQRFMGIWSDGAPVEEATVGIRSTTS